MTVDNECFPNPKTSSSQCLHTYKHTPFSSYIILISCPETLKPYFCVCVCVCVYVCVCVCVCEVSVRELCVCVLLAFN
jgi:hypothetical protein